MAEPILYMGKSGVGKSSALRNLPPEQTIIVSPNSKSFPFPGGDVKYSKENKNFYKSSSLTWIKDFIKNVSDKTDKKYLVLEDFTHYFSARIFSDDFMAQTSGNAAFQRWNQFGADVFQALFADAPNLRKDLFIIVIHHVEVKEDGTIGFKSPGKLLDNTIDVPSYFTYVFHGVMKKSEEGMQYLIQTNKDGIREAKTPRGVFDELYVNNDLKPILDRIEAYKQGDIKVTWD
jgi:hypothetical protein